MPCETVRCTTIVRNTRALHFTRLSQHSARHVAQFSCLQCCLGRWRIIVSRGAKQRFYAYISIRMYIAGSLEICAPYRPFRYVASPAPVFRENLRKNDPSSKGSNDPYTYAYICMRIYVRASEWFQNTW